METASAKPRFRRAPEGLPFALTERDVAILETIAKHRFMRTTEIAALIGGSSQQLVRRLQRLYHYSFLDRPVVKREGKGWGPFVYGVGPAAEPVLKERATLTHSSIEWLAEEPNRKESIEHALMVTEAMVAVRSACEKSSDIRFVEPEQLLGNREAQWKVQFVYDGRPHRISVVPDQVFGLEYAHLPPDRNQTIFFLEADRGTMPIQRRTLRQTSIFRKLVAYYETWRQNMVFDTFGWKRFRVLTVSTSSKRAGESVVANRQLNNGMGSGLFVFTDRSTFLNGSALEAPIQSGRSQVTRLTDSH